VAGTVTVIRDTGGATRDAATTAGARRMSLLTESGGLVLSVDVAPRKIEFGGLAHNWAEAERSGTTPLLLHSGTPLETMTFEFLVTDKLDMLAPQGATLTRLREIARTGERVLVRYSSAEAGLWRIVEASYSSDLREPDGNEVTRATASVSLKRASDAAVALGPVMRPPPPPPPPPKPPPPRTHTVRKGDTLWDIARKYYGPNAGPSWPRIFDANRSKIKDPHWIYPGQVFVIP
jgi:nucleoid-associated protein YgaU